MLNTLFQAISDDWQRAVQLACPAEKRATERKTMSVHHYLRDINVLRIAKIKYRKL